MAIGPYLTLALPAGLFRNGTSYQAKGRWYDANLIRFQQDEIKPVGGWQLRSGSAAAFTGLARCLTSWRDNSNNSWIAVGTHQKLYVQDESGTNHDITPIRRTVTLASGQIATTISSKNVTITDNAHGAIVGDFVVITNATAVGGISEAALNQVQAITAKTTNTITFAVTDAATSTTTGGGTPTLNYQITAGRADASQNLGYGGSTYGTGFYGIARPTTGNYLPATVWSLESWGQDLVGCADTDGKLYQWALDTGTAAAALSGAPTGCAALLVTQEGFLFALGAGGDGRKVQWSDQQNNTVWSPDATNQAGDYDLPTAGTLQCGKALPAGALLFTDVDAWVASYIGTPLVYGFQRVGSGCGPISKGAAAVHDAEAAWMGRGPNFWFFNGQSVQPLDCDVLDYVSDMNPNQRSKITAVHLANLGEVWWFYPSSASNECDRYVSWAYRESQRLGRNVWAFGQLARTCGSGKGIFANPLMVDPTGFLWEHETGLNMAGAVPYIESGPFEIMQGEYMAEVQRVVPDQLTDGDTSLTFFTRMWPNGPEGVIGPFPTVSPTDMMFQATEIRLRFTGAAATSWRIGSTRLQVMRGDPADSGPLPTAFILDSSQLDGSDVLS